MRLENKRALITGAGSGIGAAIAERFANEGAHVALLGRTEAKLKTIRSRLPKDRTVQAIVCDVSDPSQCEAAVRETVSALSGLDILVNSAGIFRGGGADELTLEDFETMLRINLTGPLWLSKLALGPMREAGGGAILNISSTLALRPVPSSLAYSISKAALDMMTRCLALDHGGEGIRVNAISPAIVETPIHGTVMPSDAVAEMYAQMATHHPLGRIGRPDDIAGAAVHLCSDESSWTTGSVFVVDGGLSLAGP
ncbi:MAG: SDR family oxidoreductase [Planctomycetota bacterium]